MRKNMNKQYMIKFFAYLQDIEGERSWCAVKDSPGTVTDYYVFKELSDVDEYVKELENKLKCEIKYEIVTHTEIVPA